MTVTTKNCNEKTLEMLEQLVLRFKLNSNEELPPKRRFLNAPCAKFSFEKLSLKNCENEYKYMNLEEANKEIQRLKKELDSAIDRTEFFLKNSQVSEIFYLEKGKTPFNDARVCISQMKKKEALTNLWIKSIFKDIRHLQSNNVGVVGEKLISDLCERCGISASIDGSKTKMNEIGDGLIHGKSIEIKTSSMGSGKNKNNNNFQHELGEYPWLAEFLCFVDFSPNNQIYITIMKNWSEQEYRDCVKAKPYFPNQLAFLIHLMLKYL